MEKRKLQIFGSFLVGLLLFVGGYFLYQDLRSLLIEKRSSLERIAFSASRLISASAVEQSLATKDSQTETDSQLQEQLFELANQFKVSGSLTIVDLRETPHRVVSSTRPNVRKGDPYWGAAEKLSAFQSDLGATTGIHRQFGDLTISAFAPVPAINGTASALLVYDAAASNFFYRLVGYCLHYLLLAIGLLTLGGFLFVWNSMKSSRLLDSTRSQFGTLLRESTEAVIFLNLKGQLERVNDAALTLLNENFDSLKGRSIFTGKDAGIAITPLDPSRNILKQALEYGERVQTRAKLKLKNDHTRFVLLTASPIAVGERKIGAVVVFRDITDEIIREHELIYNRVSIPESKNIADAYGMSDLETQCLNRQYLNSFLEWDRLKWMTFEGCSMILIELSGESLKSVEAANLMGRMAAFLKQFFRKGDKIVRYNDYQFIVLLPQTALKKAETIGSNLITQLSGQLEGRGLDIQIGVTELQNKELGQDWLARTEIALDRARKIEQGPKMHVQDLGELEILN